MYELVVIWYNGDKNIYTYDDRDEAEQAESNIRMAFGEQVSFTCIRTIRVRHADGSTLAW